MLDRRQTISLQSDMVQPDCKGSTHFLERHAVMEIRQSNRHKMYKVLRTILFLGSKTLWQSHSRQEAQNQGNMHLQHNDLYQQTSNT